MFQNKQNNLRLLFNSIFLHFATKSIALWDDESMRHQIKKIAKHLKLDFPPDHGREFMFSNCVSQGSTSHMPIFLCHLWSGLNYQHKTYPHYSSKTNS